MLRKSLRSGRVATLLTLAAIYGCSDERTLIEPPLQPRAAVGDVFTVTNTNDDGPGSLRATVAAATVGSTIGFDPSLAGQTIYLQSEIVLSADQIIEAPAAGGIRISGSGAVRVFNVGNAAVTLRNVSIIAGSAPFAGGIAVLGGALRLENSTVSGNSTTQFGGGGLYVDGSATLVNSTVSSNSAVFGGGGMSVRTDATVTLINSTVAGNTAGTAGGAAEILNTGRLIIRNSIVANNTATTGGSNCEPATKVFLEGQNISNDTSCGEGEGILVADPLLGGLADNGGPTRTHALLEGSPAIDAALACNVTEDQRHVTRPLGAGCDIGAFEFDDYITVTLTVDNSVAVNPNTGVAVLTGSLKCSEPVSLQLQYGLSQRLKGRVSANVTASATATLNCTTSNQFWSATLAPSSGAFQSGSASASAQTVSTPFNVIPASVAKTVKMFWGHK